MNKNLASRHTPRNLSTIPIPKPEKCVCYLAGYDMWVALLKPAQYVESLPKT